MTPRSLRVMAVVRWCMLALVTALAVTTMWRFWGAAGPGHEHAEHGLYYCPMHPQIRSPRPGECPICHMTLEPVPADRSAGASGAEWGSPRGPHRRSPRRLPRGSPRRLARIRRRSPRWS
ncbi:MAG: hypothetical protein IPI49_06435 [Myxococcales bacterium]|nr:hypothetical protein [Myxococcales bacterium]